MNEFGGENGAAIMGESHWTEKGDVELFMWRKAPDRAVQSRGTILFIHGSSMASQPTFDLRIPGRHGRKVFNDLCLNGASGKWCPGSGSGIQGLKFLDS